MQQLASVPCERDVGDDEEWPICEKVLRSLAEDVRPTLVYGDDDGDGGGSAGTGVAAGVRLCLAERVAPVVAATDEGQLRRRVLQTLQRFREQRRVTDALIAAARRTQTRLMAVRSRHADGKHYAPETPHVSRTVEEMSLWTPPGQPTNVHTFTAGTVSHDRDTGVCHLHGFADPRCRVTLDCGLLTVARPRHRSTVKVYSAFRAPTGSGDPPVLTVHHFQAFSCDCLFR